MSAIDLLEVLACSATIVGLLFIIVSIFDDKEDSSLDNDI